MKKLPVKPKMPEISKRESKISRSMLPMAAPHAAAGPKEMRKQMEYRYQSELNLRGR
jgi:hypothetical protein